MRAVVRQSYVQRVQSASDDSSQALGAQRPERRHHSKEYLSPIGPWPDFSQVAEDCVADRAAQWIGARPLGFAMRDGQHLPLPIEVLQAQGCDFPGAETVHRQ